MKKLLRGIPDKGAQELALQKYSKYRAALTPAKEQDRLEQQQANLEPYLKEALKYEPRLKSAREKSEDPTRLKQLRLEDLRKLEDLTRLEQECAELSDKALPPRSLVVVGNDPDLVVAGARAKFYVLARCEVPPAKGRPIDSVGLYRAARILDIERIKLKLSYSSAATKLLMEVPVFKSPDGARDTGQRLKELSKVIPSIALRNLLMRFRARPFKHPIR